MEEELEREEKDNSVVSKKIKKDIRGEGAIDSDKPITDEELNMFMQTDYEAGLKDYIKTTRLGKIIRSIEQMKIGISLDTVVRDYMKKGSPSFDNVGNIKIDEISLNELLIDNITEASKILGIDLTAISAKKRARLENYGVSELSGNARSRRTEKETVNIISEILSQQNQEKEIINVYRNSNLNKDSYEKFKEHFDNSRKNYDDFFNTNQKEQEKYEESDKASFLQGKEKELLKMIYKVPYSTYSEEDIEKISEFIRENGLTDFATGHKLFNEEGKITDKTIKGFRKKFEADRNRADLYRKTIEFSETDEEIEPGTKAYKRLLATVVRLYTSDDEFFISKSIEIAKKFNILDPESKKMNARELKKLCIENGLGKSFEDIVIRYGFNSKTALREIEKMDANDLEYTGAKEMYAINRVGKVITKEDKEALGRSYIYNTKEAELLELMFVNAQEITDERLQEINRFIAENKSEVGNFVKAYFKYNQKDGGLTREALIEGKKKYQEERNRATLTEKLSRYSNLERSELLDMVQDEKQKAKLDIVIVRAYLSGREKDLKIAESLIRKCDLDLFKKDGKTIDDAKLAAMCSRDGLENGLKIIKEKYEFNPRFASKRISEIRRGLIHDGEITIEKGRDKQYEKVEQRKRRNTEYEERIYIKKRKMVFDILKDVKNPEDIINLYVLCKREEIKNRRFEFVEESQISKIIEEYVNKPKNVERFKKYFTPSLPGEKYKIDIIKASQNFKEKIRNNDEAALEGGRTLFSKVAEENEKIEELQKRYKADIDKIYETLDRIKEDVTGYDKKLLFVLLAKIPYQDRMVLPISLVEKLRKIDSKQLDKYMEISQDESNTNEGLTKRSNFFKKINPIEFIKNKILRKGQKALGSGDTEQHTMQEETSTVSSTSTGIQVEEIHVTEQNKTNNGLSFDPEAAKRVSAVSKGIASRSTSGNQHSLIEDENREEDISSDER